MNIKRYLYPGPFTIGLIIFGLMIIYYFKPKGEFHKQEIKVPVIEKYQVIEPNGVLPPKKIWILILENGDTVKSVSPADTVIFTTIE